MRVLDPWCFSFGVSVTMLCGVLINVWFSLRSYKLSDDKRNNITVTTYLVNRFTLIMGILTHCAVVFFIQYICSLILS